MARQPGDWPTEPGDEAPIGADKAPSRRTAARSRGRVAPRSALKTVLVWAALVAVAGANLFVIGLGGWHFYRYVVAPKIGWVSAEERWHEHLRVATSPFRLLEEKEVALAAMLEQPAPARTLSEAERAAAIRALDDVVHMPDYPLELKYLAARVQTLLKRGDSPAPTRREARDARVAAAAATAAAQAVDDMARLAQLVRVPDDELRATSPERTEVLIRLFRHEPCRPELLQWIERLDRRAQVPPLERSFLYGIQGQRQLKCTSSATE